MRSNRLRRVTLAAWLVGVGLLAPDALRADGSDGDRFDTVIIDAGHGGDDEGARGPGGTLEKDVVLGVAKGVAAALRERALSVVMTREHDAFISLERRTSIANDVRGDLFVSIHANASEDASIRGTETFFLSLEASDEAAQRAAERENRAFGVASPVPAASDPLLGILGDLMAQEHLTESQAFAGLAQARLAQVPPGRSRGIKQAPFVVLSGVQMPASLVEIGFITNPGDERVLSRSEGRREIVAALVEAVIAFGRRYDARHRIGGLPGGRAR